MKLYVRWKMFTENVYAQYNGPTESTVTQIGKKSGLVDDQMTKIQLPG